VVCSGEYRKLGGYLQTDDRQPIPFPYINDARARVGEYVFDDSARIVQVVPGADWIATQDWISTAKVQEFIAAYDTWHDSAMARQEETITTDPDDDGPPVVVERLGKIYIADGHHRITAAYLLNRPLTVLKVLLR
jgi:hypothetical protein